MSACLSFRGCRLDGRSGSPGDGLELRVRPVSIRRTRLDQLLEPLEVLHELLLGLAPHEPAEEPVREELVRRLDRRVEVRVAVVLLEAVAARGVEALVVDVD